MAELRVPDLRLGTEQDPRWTICHCPPEKRDIVICACCSPGKRECISCGNLVDDLKQGVIS